MDTRKGVRLYRVPAAAGILALWSVGCGELGPIREITELAVAHVPAVVQIGDTANVRIHVTDQDGRDVWGAAVLFTPVGEGSVSAREVVSDEQGYVDIEWFFGLIIGTRVLQVESGKAELAVTVQVSAAPPAEIVPVSPLAVSARPQEKADEVALLVTDRFGHPSEGVRVIFRVTAGTLGRRSMRTGADGLATTDWTFGAALQGHFLRAVVEDVGELLFTGEVLPGLPQRMERIGGPFRRGPVAEALPGEVRVRIFDRFDSPVPGVVVEFLVTEGEGRVDPLVVTTDRDGFAGTVWTLGETAGLQLLLAQITESVSTDFQAIATPADPDSIVMVSGALQVGVINSRLRDPLRIQVQDRFGNPVPESPLQLMVTLGGGVVTPSEALTDKVGSLEATWLMGPAVGSNRLLVTSPGTEDLALEATAIVGVPAAMELVRGSEERSVAGRPVEVLPQVKVVNQAGSPISGVSVHFEVRQGGGMAAGVSQVSSAEGTATVGSWRLGVIPGANLLTASSGNLPPVDFFVAGIDGNSRFSVQVRFLGSPPTAGQRAAFDAAAARWSSIILEDLPDVSVSLAAGVCPAPHPALNEVIDDLVIFASVPTIDGRGGILASAGPCLLREGKNGLPYLGVMRFDSADMAVLESDGRLADVVLHEMGHVLGIGTLWQPRTLLTGAGSSDPFFTGSKAINQFFALGGTAQNPVPVENTGGAGTRDGHWRESVFATELMTGFISSPGVANPLSRVTVASLDDLGYGVDLTLADPFSLGSSSAAPPGVGAPWPTLQIREILLKPVELPRGTRR